MRLCAILGWQGPTPFSANGRLCRAQEWRLGVLPVPLPDSHGRAGISSVGMVPLACFLTVQAVACTLTLWRGRPLERPYSNLVTTQAWYALAQGARLGQFSALTGA